MRQTMTTLPIGLSLTRPINRIPNLLQAQGVTAMNQTMTTLAIGRATKYQQTESTNLVQAEND